MIKDVLVYLNGSEADAGRLDHAERLCAQYEGHLTALHCNPLPEIALGTEAAAMAVHLTLADQEAAMQRGDAAEAALRKRVGRLAVPGELRRYDIFPDQVGRFVAQHARANDILVALRPDAVDRDAETALEAAIFGGGRSVLVVPPETEPRDSFPTVLIGWSDTRESARALHEAAPFLAKADQVVLATVETAGPPERWRTEPAADIARHLDRLGISAEVRHISGWDNVAEALVQEARMLGADLLVTGAYGHSRFLEWIVGGTTRELLAGSPVPLLMAH